jgi:D-glycero-D-manno-heptose 1,7-bisphosphate phosphatase
MNKSATAKTRLRPAVFLDRDGTITPEMAQYGEAYWREYGADPAKLRLLRGAGQALRRLNESGFAVVLVTNQSGVARGYFTEADVQAVNAQLQKLLAKHGAHFDAIYYCPHHPEGKVLKYRRNCRCRKPAAGLFSRAARELNLDLSRSFAIGDNVRDLLPLHKLGGRTILVLTGLGETMVEASEGIANAVVANLTVAVKWILSK